MAVFDKFCKILMIEIKIYEFYDNWKTDLNLLISQKIDQFFWKSHFFVFCCFGCIWWHIGINGCGIYTGTSALPTICMNTLWLYSLSFKWIVKTEFWDEFLKLIIFLRNEHVGISFFQLIYDVYNDVSLCLGPLRDISQCFAFIFGHFWQILQNFDDWNKNLRILWSMKNRSQHAYFAKNWSVFLKIPIFCF